MRQIKFQTYRAHGGGLKGQCSCPKPGRSGAEDCFAQEMRGARSALHARDGRTHAQRMACSLRAIHESCATLGKTCAECRAVGERVWSAMQAMDTSGPSVCVAHELLGIFEGDWCAARPLDTAFGCVATYLFTLARELDPLAFDRGVRAMARGHDVYASVLRCPIVTAESWAEIMNSHVPRCAVLTSAALLTRIHYGHVEHMRHLATAHPDAFVDAMQATIHQYGCAHVLQEMCTAGRVEMVHLLSESVRFPAGLLCRAVQADAHAATAPLRPTSRRHFAQCVRVSEWRVVLATAIFNQRYDLAEAVSECLAETVRTLAHVGGDVHAWVTHVQAFTVARASALIALVVAAEEAPLTDRLLASFDTFVTGSTHYAGLLCMRRHCTRPLTSGYEVETSRDTDVPCVLLSLLDGVLKKGLFWNWDTALQQRVARLLSACASPQELTDYSALLYLYCKHRARRQHAASGRVLELVCQLTPFAYAGEEARPPEGERATTAGARRARFRDWLNAMQTRTGKPSKNEIVAHTWSRALASWHCDPSACHDAIRNTMTHECMLRGLLCTFKNNHTMYSESNLTFLCRAMPRDVWAHPALARHLYTIAFSMASDASWFAYASATQYVFREYCNADLAAAAPSFSISRHPAPATAPDACQAQLRAQRLAIKLWNHASCVFYNHVCALIGDRSSALSGSVGALALDGAGSGRDAASEGVRRALLRAQLLTRLTFVLSAQMCKDYGSANFNFAPRDSECTARMPCDSSQHNQPLHCACALGSASVLCALDPLRKLSEAARTVMASLIAGTGRGTAGVNVPTPDNLWASLVGCPQRVRTLVCTFCAHT